MPSQTIGLAAAAALLHRAKLLLFSTAAPSLLSSTALPFSTTTPTLPPSSTPHFMTQYLISNCGFSPSDAAKFAKRLSHVDSPAGPDASLRFLRRLGLGGAAVRNVLASDATILVADVAKTLEPKIASLRGFGFSGADITGLVAANPAFLRRNALPKLQLLEAYLPSRADLLKALRRNPNLLHCDLAASLVPNVALLRAHGVPERRIRYAATAMPRLLTRGAAFFSGLFHRVAGLGFPCDKLSFLLALFAMSRLSEETFRSKMEWMQRSWWSEAEFHAAFRKYPNVMCYTEETLRAKMRFLVEDAGLAPGRIAERPSVLQYSLEKRLVPRHRVLQILKAEGLPGAGFCLSSMASLGEKKFLQTYVLPHLESVPALLEVYPDAGASKV